MLLDGGLLLAFSIFIPFFESVFRFNYAELRAFLTG